MSAVLGVTVTVSAEITDFNEPEVEWDVTDTVNPEGKPLRFRTLRFRADD